MTEQALVSDIKDCLFFKNDEDNPNAKGEELNLGLVEAKCSEFNISRKKIQIGGGGCILNRHIYYASSQISRSFYEIAKTSSISVLKNHIWLKRNEETKKSLTHVRLNPISPRHFPTRNIVEYRSVA